MSRIHAIAWVDERAELADDVEVGAGCIIEADTRIGPGCRLEPYVVIRRYTTLGRNNQVGAGSVLGGDPQDFKFKPSTVSYLTIGDDNIFREHVTISRAVTPGEATAVGNHTFWMAGSHAGHDAVIGDRVILTNGACVAGHAILDPGAILSAHVVVHQFCRIGEKAMCQGNSGMSKHIPPYCMIADINRVAGLNLVGLRRDERISSEDVRQIKEAYKILYRSSLTTPRALERMDTCSDWGEAASRFREFVRWALAAKKPYDRGICPPQRNESAGANASLTPVS